MNTIGALLLLGLLALAWWNAVGARTTARRAARAACEKAGVGFIDEVALARLRLGRNARGGLGLERIYRFEFFVAGDRRYAGEVVLRARRVAAINLEPYPT